MKNKLFYFLCGFISMWLISIIVIAYNPTPKTDVVCGGCGSYQWYSVLAKGDE